MFGLIIQIVKAKTRDVSSLDNCRPIILNPVSSKLFELVLRDLVYDTYMINDDLQFGLKKKIVVHIECPYWMSILDVHIGCPYWMSILDVHIGCPYWMSILDVHIGCPY